MHKSYFKVFLFFRINNPRPISAGARGRQHVKDP